MSYKILNDKLLNEAHEAERRQALNEQQNFIFPPGTPSPNNYEDMYRWWRDFVDFFIRRGNTQDMIDALVGNGFFVDAQGYVYPPGSEDGFMGLPLNFDNPLFPVAPTQVPQTPKMPKMPKPGPVVEQMMSGAGGSQYVMWNNGGWRIIRTGIAPDFSYMVIGPDSFGIFKSYQEAVNQLPAGVHGMGPGEIGPDPQAPDDKGDNMQMRSMPRMSPNKMPSFMIGGRSLNQGLYK